MNPLENFKLLKKLINEINHVLKGHGVNRIVDLSDFTVTDKIIIDQMTRGGGKLSEALINHIWPSISSITLDHYTSLESAQSIIDTNVFRLYSILKRFKDHEIVSFCTDHGWAGYLDNDDDGDAIYKKMIMPNTFYASFTDADPCKNDLWKKFGAVRITFSINASKTDLRKMVYSDGNPIKIIKDIENVCREYDKEFILKGASRMCAFYLPDGYRKEAEYRVLYRHWHSPCCVKNDGRYDYLEIPIGNKGDYGLILEIKSIMTDEQILRTEKIQVLPR